MAHSEYGLAIAFPCCFHYHFGDRCPLVFENLVGFDQTE